MKSNRKELWWANFTLIIASFTITTLAAEIHDLWLLIPWTIIGLVTIANMILTRLLEA